MPTIFPNSTYPSNNVVSRTSSDWSCAAGNSCNKNSNTDSKNQEQQLAKDMDKQEQGININFNLNSNNSSPSTVEAPFSIEAPYHQSQAQYPIMPMHNQYYPMPFYQFIEPEIVNEQIEEPIIDRVYYPVTPGQVQKCKEKFYPEFI